MQVGVTCVSIPDKSFVVATTRAQRAGPTAMTVVFGADVTPGQKIVLLLQVQTGRYMSKRVRIGIDKAVARCDIAGRSHAHQPQAGAAWMGLVDTLVEL